MSRLNRALQYLLAENFGALYFHPEPNKALAALNAIIEAGTGDAEANKRFRQAILDHHEFWNQLTRNLIDPRSNPEADDFLAPAGDPDPAGPIGSFVNLTKLAVTGRIVMSLRSATEQQLEAIINAPDDIARRKTLFNDDGTSIFGQPQATVARWNSGSDEILNHHDLDYMRLEAQRHLLFKKIEAYDQPDIAAKMDRLINCNNQNDFKIIVRELFGQTSVAPPVHAIADGMQFDMIHGFLIQQAAAKKGLVSHIKQLSEHDVLAHSLNTLNIDDPAAFRGRFLPMPSAAHLHERDINDIKAVLGTRFLTLRVQAFGPDKLTQLEGVAISDTEDTTKALLKAFPELTDGGGGNYIDHVVKTSLLEIRKAFATQALMIKIAQCDDVETLDALVAANTVEKLKAALASNSELGYNDKPQFRDALTGTDVNKIIALAHIRKNLSFSDRPEHLRELIGITDATLFKAKYDERFSAGTANAVKDAIHRHFDTPENITQARKQALVTYAKTEMSKLSDMGINGLINAGNANDVMNQAQFLFPSASMTIADDLLRAPQPHDAGISKELRTYAAIEGITRIAKKPNQDFSIARGNDNHTGLLNAINRFDFKRPYSALLGAPDFPAKEKLKIQAILVESLLKNYPKDRLGLPVVPPAVDKLTELVKETDLAKFKQLLTDKFGVTDVDWVNEFSMKQMQKAACIRAIELGEKHPLRFGSEAHPALFKLIAQLPLPKLQALLDKPAVLTALALAPSKAAVEDILGGKDLVDDASISLLIDENKRLLQIAKIANSEIATILAKIQPPVDVTPAIVNSINSQLLRLPITDDNEYITAIGVIVALFARPREAELYQALGLDADGDEIEDEDISDAIMDQHRYNKHLIKKYDNADTLPESKAIIMGLLALSKKDEFPLNRIFKQTGAGAHEGIVTDIKNSKTLADFLRLVNTPPGRDYKDIFDPSLDKQLTPQSFEQLKIKARAKALTSARHYKKTLEAQKDEVDLIEQQFSQMVLEGGDREKLQRLTEVNPIYWFNPAFQAAAKQNATTMGPELRELAKQCDSYVTYLTNQHRQIKAQIDSLPTKGEIAAGGASPSDQQAMRKAIDKRRTELVALSKRVEDELVDYKELQVVFNGDPAADNSIHPLVRQGLLKTLDMAVAGTSDIRLSGFNGHYVDCDNSTKADHMKATWAGEARPGAVSSGHATMELEGADENFDIVPAIPAGKFREHTVVYHDGTPEGVKGLYIEERAPHDLAGQIKPDGTVNYEPSVKLTASKFPPQSKPDARMYFAMSMASQMLATLKTAPTAENPIKLRGADPVQLRYLWTALMILGESDKNLKFKHDAIKVFSAQFDPKSEFSMAGLRWSGDALYHQFKANPQLGAWMSGIKDINEKKFSTEQQEVREQAMQDTSELTGFFKGKMTEIAKENKLHEDGHAASLGSTGSTGPRT